MFPSASVTSNPRSHRVCELRSITVRFGERIVLDRIDLAVGAADRLAVIGDNGAGKSTLLDVLAGVVASVAGETRVEIPGGVAHASQEPRFPAGATVRDAVDLLLTDLRALESELRQCAERLAAAEEHAQPALLARFGDLADRFEARDGYGVDQRVDAALDQLGLGGLDRDRAVSGLSGGECARLTLAVALSANAELLLLDEPTNDLDASALAWLEGRLAAHRGAMVVVTHDRAFLERFADDIVQVRDGGLHRYGSGYARLPGGVSDRAAPPGGAARGMEGRARAQRGARRGQLVPAPGDSAQARARRLRPRRLPGARPRPWGDGPDPDGQGARRPAARRARRTATRAAPVRR